MKPSALPYAPPPPRSRRGRVVRWGLVLLAATALAWVSRPGYRAARAAYDGWALRRALTASLHQTTHDDDVVSFAQGREPVAELRASPRADEYSLADKSAVWRDERALRYSDLHGRVTGTYLNNGNVFFGAVRNAAGAVRLLAVSLQEGSWNDWNLRVRVIDPGPGGGSPKVVSTAGWDVAGARQGLPVRVWQGRADAAAPGRLVARMRYGTDEHQIVLALDAADQVTLSSSLGWHDQPPRGRWWLDAPDQRLVTLAAKPAKVPLFPGALGYAVPAAARGAGGLFVGAYPRGLTTAKADADGTWAVRSLVDWPAEVRNIAHWRLRASPDGHRIFAGAAGGGLPAMLSGDGLGSPVPINLPHGVRYDARFSPDGTRLYTADLAGTTVARSTHDGRELWAASVRGECVSVGGDLVSVIEPEHDQDWRTPTTIALLSAADGSVLRRLQTPSDQDHAALSPDGRSIAVATQDEWRVCDTATGQVRHRFAWPQRAFHWAEPAWSPDGRLVAMPGHAHVHLWDLRRPQTIYRLPIPTEDPRSHAVTVSADGRWLIVTTAGEADVRVWDLKDAVPAR